MANSMQNTGNRICILCSARIHFKDTCNKQQQKKSILYTPARQAIRIISYTFLFSHSQCVRD